uniref:Glycosyltransferase n=2 Tax=unclassified Prevotella TaxID=2638335 RepID=A0AB33IZ37_9BACT
MKKIAVLLTVHNRKAMTIRCLAQVFNQKIETGKYQLEVYLTDDGCTDGTSEAVQSQFPQVHVIAGDGNLFWNRGMYVAWDAASKSYDYDYYLWLNDDTFIYDDCIDRLLRTSESYNNESVIVGTCCAVGNQSIITYGGCHGLDLIKDISQEQSCDTFNGNIVLIPAFVYHKLGQLDYRYHHACGDTDYGFRVSDSGLRNIVPVGILGECNEHDRIEKWRDPSVPVRMRWNNYFFNHRTSDTYLCFSKHYGKFYAIRVTLTSFLHMLMPRVYNLIKG